jgi:hypothetical protein
VKAGSSPSEPVAPSTCSSSTPSVIGSSITLTVSSSATGFSENCYFANSGDAMNIIFDNLATNPSSGMPFAMAFSISEMTRPVIGQAVNTGTNAEAPAGLLPATATPLPVINDQNALFVSPTASDQNPLTFMAPALPPGQYSVQLLTAPRLQQPSSQ